MKRFSLAARHPAASEPCAAASRAREAVDGSPADTPGIADPSLAIRGDAGKKRQLAEPAVGLRPVAMAILFESPEIQRGADRIDAIGVAFGVHASQQVSAARAVRETGTLRFGLAGERHAETQKQVFQRVVHRGFQDRWRDKS